MEPIQIHATPSSQTAQHKSTTSMKSTNTHTLPSSQTAQHKSITSMKSTNTHTLPSSQTAQHKSTTSMKSTNTHTLPSSPTAQHKSTTSMESTNTHTLPSSPTAQHKTLSSLKILTSKIANTGLACSIPLPTHQDTDLWDASYEFEEDASTPKTSDYYRYSHYDEFDLGNASDCPPPQQMRREISADYRQDDFSKKFDYMGASTCPPPQKLQRRTSVRLHETVIAPRQLWCETSADCPMPPQLRRETSADCPMPPQLRRETSDDIQHGLSLYWDQVLSALYKQELPIAYAVGGNETDRQERAQIVTNVLPDLQSRVLELGGKAWMIPPLTNYCKNVLNPIDTPSAPVPMHKLNNNSVVWLIGHMDPAAFVALVRTNPQVHLWVLQGAPGFNFLDFANKLANWKELNTLLDPKKMVCFGNTQFGQLGPTPFTQAQWDALFEYYPQSLQQLATIATMSFVVTRNKYIKVQKGVATDAFHRQSCLEPLIANGMLWSFEYQVAKLISNLVPCCASTALVCTIKAAKALTGITPKEVTALINHVHTAYTCWRETISVTHDMNALLKRVSPAFTAGINKVMTDMLKLLDVTFSTLEYDAGAVVVGGLTLAGYSQESIKKILETLHYKLLLFVLSNTVKGNEYGELDELLDVLSIALAPHNHTFLHDMTMDMKNDDYLALKLARFLVRWPLLKLLRETACNFRAKTTIPY